MIRDHNSVDTRQLTAMFVGDFAVMTPFEINTLTIRLQNINHPSRGTLCFPLNVVWNRNAVQQLKFHNSNVIHGL